MQQPPNIQEDLVIKARNGDTTARAELYRMYSQAMYNKCIRMTGNKTDAEDLLHDAFIYAFEHLGQVKQPAAFGGWLGRIVVGKCIRFSKTNLRWNELNNDHTGEPSEEEAVWWTNIPLEKVQEEIKNLPNGCRQVFVLFTLENFGHKAIAENLGISESTSKSQYQRARQLLKERLTYKKHDHG